MKKLEITYNGQKIEIGYFLRRGQKETVLYLHGLGCSKSDFFNATELESLQAHTLIALDFPGHGNSSYQENLGMDYLVEIVNLSCEKLDLNNIVLIGHSMGGLVALLFAEKYADKVKAFINVEGNLKDEDCFFSREVIKHSYDDFLNYGFDKIKGTVAAKKNTGFQSYVGHLQKMNPRAYYDYCPSMIEYSTHGKLINEFIKLDMPKLFMYGSENAHLTYLGQLRDNEIQVAEIAGSNHWPMLDNPQEFYYVISNFLNKV